VRRQVTDQVHHQVWDQVHRQVSSQVRSQVYGQALGQVFLVMNSIIEALRDENILDKKQVPRGGTEI